MTERDVSAGSFKIRVSGDIADCEVEWAELEQHGASTPFQTRAWLKPWYAIAAPYFEATPLVVSVCDRSSGAPLMLLPLCARREGRLRVVEFADGGLSDYNAPLFAKTLTSNKQELDQLWRAIRSSLAGADILRLEKQPAVVLGCNNPLVGLPGMRAMSIATWGIALPATRADFDERILGASFRAQVRKKRRRLAGRGAVRFVNAANEAEGRKIFSELAAMRESRFEELGRKNVLGEPVLREFYEAVIFGDWGKQFAALSALEVDGEAVAALFALRRANAYLLVMSSFKAGPWKSSSPGNVAIDFMVSQLIETGVSYFDFTIGNETYKSDFGAVATPLYAGVQSLSIGGWPLAVKQSLKGIVRDSAAAPFARRAVAMARRALRAG